MKNKNYCTQRNYTMYTTKNLIEDLATRVSDLSQVESKLLRKVLTNVKSKYSINFCIRCGSVGQALDLKAIECPKCKLAQCEFCKPREENNHFYRYTLADKTSMKEYDDFIKSSTVSCNQKYHDELVKTTYPYVFDFMFMRSYFIEIREDLSRLLNEGEDQTNKFVRSATKYENILKRQTLENDEFINIVGSVNIAFQHVFRHHQIEIAFEFYDKDERKIETEDTPICLQDCSELINRYIDAHNATEILYGYIVRMFDPALIYLFKSHDIKLYYANFAFDSNSRNRKIHDLIDYDDETEALHGTCTYIYQCHDS